MVSMEMLPQENVKLVMVFAKHVTDQPLLNVFHVKLIDSLMDKYVVLLVLLVNTKMSPIDCVHHAIQNVKDVKDQMLINVKNVHLEDS